MHSEHDHYLLREILIKARKRVNIGDYKGPWYKDIAVPPIVANGQLDYAAQKRNEKWVVNCEGNEGPEHFGIRTHRLPKHIDLFLDPGLYLHLSRNDLEAYLKTLRAQNPALRFLGGKIVYVAIDEDGLQQVRTYYEGKFYGDINPKFKSIYWIQEFGDKIAYFGEMEMGGLVKTVLMVGLNNVASFNRDDYLSLSPFLEKKDGKFSLLVHCRKDEKREIPFTLT